MTNHPSRKQVQFFARTNPYGSNTSVGFDNTFSAIVFETRHDRDSFVAANADSNLATKPLTRAQALKLADRNGDDHYLRTIDGRYLKIK